MSEHALIGITLIIALGIGAQWLAWRIRVPAILLLLLLGCLAGPGTQWLQIHGWIEHRLLDPDGLFGALLLPVVSLSVAVILFEGGLTLNFRELSFAGGVILRLVTIGALITFAIATCATHWIIGVSWALSFLFGAVLVVTGPTVIGPLLRHVRPTGRVGPIVKWEGIVIDPIGAMLAVLVFEAIPVHTQTSVAAMLIVRSVLLTLGVSALLASAAAGLLVLLLRKRWIADYLETPMALALIVTVFTLSNTLQPESGLFAATMMGVILANQRSAVIHHIAEFKENLRLLLVSGLFIAIGARLRLDQISAMGWRQVLLVIALVVVARPIAVFVSTIRSSLNWREKMFIAWMAPRGVVAAAVTSVFALRLAAEKTPDAAVLVPTVFAVIIGTVAIYGLTASRVAVALGLARPEAMGFLIVGANRIAREIAQALVADGLDVLLVDTSAPNIAAARLAGLPVHFGSINSSSIVRRIELSGIGRLLALTSNEDVNALACLHLARTMGRSEVYQLTPTSSDAAHREKVMQALRGRVLFAQDLTYENLSSRFATGAKLKKTKLTDAYTLETFRQTQGERSVPLFMIDNTGALTVVTADAPATAKAGQSIIYLADAG